MLLQKQKSVVIYAEAVTGGSARWEPGLCLSCVPSSQGSSQTGGENQVFEDDPAEVSSQTGTETRMTDLFPSSQDGEHKRGEECNPNSDPFNSRGSTCWSYDWASGSGQLKRICLYHFLFFAYSEMYKFTIWLRLNLKWHHYWYQARPGHPDDPQTGIRLKTMTWSLKVGFSRYYNFIINYTIHVANEKLYRGAKGHK